ncbi:MAG: FAD synthetase family protein [Chloroflexota bacterium]|nr:FAD synthetase family protein [Chloroflexota bacterium]
MSAPHAYAIDRLPEVGPGAICMGVFDGVHGGHLSLIAATVHAARERGASSVALVFDPHPDEVVHPGTVVPRLSPLADNLRRLRLAGIDHAVPVRFDAGLRSLTAEGFLDVLAPSIRLKALVMTPEAAFGRNRAGTPDAMGSYGRAVGFDVILADQVTDELGPISSARIRAALAAGELAAATSMLGHPPYLEAALADPTEGGVQLGFAYAPALPAPGRYRAVLHDPGDSRASPREAILEVGADSVARLAGLVGALPHEPTAIDVWPAP